MGESKDWLVKWVRVKIGQHKDQRVMFTQNKDQTE